MAEKWRRCAKCSKIKSVDDFDGDETTCRACLTAPVRAPRTAASRVTTTRADPEVAAAATSPAGTRVTVRDVRGRGDHEVRARRARVRALDRLAEEYPDDFARLLAEERATEAL